MRKLRPKTDKQLSTRNNQQGFITLIIFLVVILVTVLALAYIRVLKAQK